MKVGIVGHAENKFTMVTRSRAMHVMVALLSNPGDVLVLGGIDIWAEELADALGMPKIIHVPATHNWSDGYKPRNLLIAHDCDEIHVIVVDKYPSGYSGMTFDSCYHCNTNTHVKSGGCWTAKQVQLLGKPAYWHIIDGGLNE